MSTDNNKAQYIVLFWFSLCVLWVMIGISSMIDNHKLTEENNRFKKILVENKLGKYTSIESSEFVLIEKEKK